MVDRRAFVVAAGGAAAAMYTKSAFAQVAAPPISSSLRSLAGRLTGSLVTQGSPGYDQARLVYNERFDAVRPLAVAEPASVADVQRIVSWAGSEGVRPIPRSSGHSYAGYSTGLGLVIDLSRLNGIALDDRTGIATIGSGARLIDVEVALASRGRAIPGGSCATVAMGGLAQGGGVGLASRMFGTTSDNILSFGIVTADGRFRDCYRDSNEELFWACRGGGGGNFGVVTHFRFRTHPVGNVSYFFADWDWARAAEVIEAWLAFAPHAPDELFSICSLSAGGGSPTVQVFGQYLGAESTLQRVLAQLQSVPGLRLDTGTSSYLDAQFRWAGCLGKTAAECHLVGETPQGTLERALFDGKSDYLTAPLSAAGRATIVSWIERAATTGFGSAALLLDSYGGAINRLDPSETAFVHRNAVASAQYLAYWSGGAEQALRWIRGFYAAMRPHVSGYAYQNYIDHDLTTWPHAYYGANYPRLQSIKRDVDPHELFHFAQSIRPA